jgi:hypothetical protein
MFARGRSSVPTLFGVYIALQGALSFGADIKPLFDSKEAFNTQPMANTEALRLEIPARPAGHVLDTANFLGPELLQRLEAALSEEARTADVHIYLLTVPSMPKNSLDAFGKRVAETWTNGLFGGVIVFDDGTGQVAIEPSGEVLKRFHEFELALLMESNMDLKHRPKHSRDGLEHTAGSLRTALHELKMRANRQDRSSLSKRIGLAAFGLIALLVGTLVYFRQSRSGTRSDSGEGKAELG